MAIRQRLASELERGDDAVKVLGKHMYKSTTCKKFFMGDRLCGRLLKPERNGTEQGGTLYNFPVITKKGSI